MSVYQSYIILVISYILTTFFTTRSTTGKEGKQFGVPMEAAAFTGHVQGVLEEIQVGRGKGGNRSAAK